MSRSNEIPDSTEEELGLSRTPSKRSSMNRHTVLLLQGQVEELEAALEEKERERLSSQVAVNEAGKALETEKTKFEKFFSQYMVTLNETEEKCRSLEQQRESLEKTVSADFMI